TKATAAAPALAASDDRESLLGYAGNNLKNATAMNLLHGGFQGPPRRRFLPTKDETAGPLRTDALSGVETYVLGPSRNPEVIREMDPPESESFLRAWSMERGDATRPSPFADAFTLTRPAHQN